MRSTRSSGGSKDAKEVWRIVWCEEHEHGTYTKSTKVYSEYSVRSKVSNLKYRLKDSGHDLRWHRPVLWYTVDRCPLNWERVEEGACQS